MKPSPTVLIIQTAFIGDVILATSLIESIRAKIPDAVIDFVLRKGNEELLIGNPGLRNVHVLDKARKYKSLIHLIKQFRQSRYDYVINVQRFATTGLMTIFSGGKLTIGFDKNPFSFLYSRKAVHQLGNQHEVIRNLRLLEPLGILEHARPRLYPSADEIAQVDKYKSHPYITISPASVWFTKQWPAEKWVSVLKEVGDMRTFLLGGPRDFDHCEKIRSQLPNQHIANLSGTLSLLESAALMKDARMNFVNDSAPLHLASAMNAPVTAVFCSTIPDFGFGPLSDQSFIVQTKEILSCRPCGLHGKKACPQGHFRCATTIQPDQLIRSLA